MVDEPRDRTDYGMDDEWFNDDKKVVSLSTFFWIIFILALLLMLFPIR